jgi:hypothetical protein
MLEKKLQEELKRYKAINKYSTKMIMEQEAPVEPSPEGELPMEPTADGTEVPPMEDPSTPPMDGTTDPTLGEVPVDDATEEIDITDLVNMTKSIKNDLDDNRSNNGEVVSKMDSVFSKLNDLESKLSQMDSVIAKIDQLGYKVENMKPETPQEKLEMRSLDSYPFNQKPNEFFSQKQGEMKASGKNEYVLTKQDVQNYSPETISKTFNTDEKEDEFKF